MSILAEIISNKEQEIEALKEARPLFELKEVAKQYAPRGFASKLRFAQLPAVIAEVKRRSPSRGPIREDLAPAEIAAGYRDAGAACISVLTDEKYFGGKLSDLEDVRSVVDVPLLRKDFTLDPYQVWEARAAGADAILLIVAALSSSNLVALLKEGISADLDVLVEVHNDMELASAISAIKELGTNHAAEVLVGINNRDLKNFRTDISVTKSLAGVLKNRVKESNISDLLVVSESGITSAIEMYELHKYGADAYLVGEHLLSEGDPKDNLNSLINSTRDFIEKSSGH